MYKKADVGLGVIILVVIVMIFIGWAANMGYRECRSNKECSAEEYCGSDFACHKIPVIEKQPIVVQRDYSKPAWVLGVCIVIASILFNLDKISTVFQRKEKEKIYTNFPIYYEKASK